MLLRHPITAFASHHVDLTGGLMSRFEDFVITSVKNYRQKRQLRKELSIMTEHEMRDLGLTRYDLALIADGKYNPSETADR